MEGGIKLSGDDINHPAQESAEGATFPITLVLSTAIGIWLMFTRLTFDSVGSMANSDHVVGALIVTLSITAFAEVARSVRFVNLLFGAWLMAAPWLLDGVSSSLATANSLLCGLALIALVLPRGKINHSYAGWDRYIR